MRPWKGDMMWLFFRFCLLFLFLDVSSFVLSFFSPFIPFLSSLSLNFLLLELLVLESVVLTEDEEEGNTVI